MDRCIKNDGSIMLSILSNDELIPSFDVQTQLQLRRRFNL